MAPRTPFARASRRAKTQFGLIRRDQLCELGFTDEAIEWMVRSGQLDRLHAGVFAFAGTPAVWEQAALAAVFAGWPDAVLSHRAAAWLWDLVDHPDDLIDLVGPRSKAPRPAGVAVHRSMDLAPHHVTRRRGIFVTTPMRTLVDLGAVRPDLVADAVERALLTKVLSHLAIERALDEVARRGRAGAGVLRRVMDTRALGKDRPESLLEVRMARLMLEYGLPVFIYQHRVRLPGRRHPVRVDFAYPELMLAIEVDGFRHHSTPEQLAADAARQEALEALGWKVIRFTWTQVVRRPAWVARQLKAECALASAA
jgi:hypothetical protein